MVNCHVECVLPQWHVPGPITWSCHTSSFFYTVLSQRACPWESLSTQCYTHWLVFHFVHVRASKFIVHWQTFFSHESHVQVFSKGGCLWQVSILWRLALLAVNLLFIKCYSHCMAAAVNTYATQVKHFINWHVCLPLHDVICAKILWRGFWPLLAHHMGPPAMI